MLIESNKDIRLVQSAMRKGWNVPDNVKEDCIAQLAAIAAGSEKDSDRVAAIKALMTADAIDAKREKDESDRRLQLLELARRVPVGELTKLASDNGIVDGRSISEADDGSGSGQG